jgi:hypothetical protein
MLTVVQDSGPLDDLYARTVPPGVADVDLLEGSVALAVPKQSRQRCSGSDTAAVAAYPTGTYFALAHCCTCGHWVRVKSDGRLRAHHGRATRCHR